jgi:hypothetical protein
MGLPFLKMVIFHGYVSHNQMVCQFSMVGLYNASNEFKIQMTKLIDGPHLMAPPTHLEISSLQHSLAFRMCFERSDRQSSDSMALISSALPCLRFRPIVWRYLEMIFHEFQDLFPILLFELTNLGYCHSIVHFHHCFSCFDGLPNAAMTAGNHGKR